MSDFRKQMHVEYKKKMHDILLQYTYDLANLECSPESSNEFIKSWIDRNCLPMGDFSKENAIKEIEEWQKD